MKKSRQPGGHDPIGTQGVPHGKQRVSIRTIGHYSPAPEPFSQAVTGSTPGRRDVVFIDSSLEHRDALIEALPMGVEVQLLDAHGDGLAQMARWAALAQDYDALHLLCHGRPGVLQLGAVTLDAQTMEHYALDLAVIGRSLTPRVPCCSMAAISPRAARVRPLSTPSPSIAVPRLPPPVARPAPGSWVATGRSTWCEAMLRRRPRRC